MIIRKYIRFDEPLTAEQEARLKALAALPDDEIVFDEDCPELTDEQLAQMKRVNPLHDERRPRAIRKEITVEMSGA